MPLSPSQSKKRGISSFVIGTLILFILSSILPGLFFPSDILSYLPSFSEAPWSRPHNSLLADPVFQTEPWRHYTKQQLLMGDFPLWNDKNAAGVPFFANMQSAVLYPLNIFYYFLPVQTALYFISFLKIYLLGLFLFLYLLSLGISKRSSLIGGIVAAFSGFPMTWLMWPHTNVFILFPLLLFLTEKIFAKREDRVLLFSGMSISYAVAIFGGHPETLFHVSLLHFVYILFRFWKRKKEMLLLFLSIIGGFFLGAVQLLPFLEYLFQSSAFAARTIHTSSVFFPFLSFLEYLFPFLYGAPHTQFYKALDGINFQEGIGGYVGSAVFLSAVFTMIALRKNRMVTFWAGICFFIWAVTFKVWPFWYLTFLPIFNVTANHRLISFTTVALSVLFAFFLESVGKKRERMVKKHMLFFNHFLIAGSSFCLLFLAGIFFIYHPIDRFHQFLKFLSLHVLFILLTTAVYFLLLFFLMRRRLLRSSYVYILLIPLLFQTLGLLWNYYPITKQGQYYPQTSLIKKMQELPAGRYLEVGNLNLPEDINLMYGLSQAENYDAMENYLYKEAFNNAFPDKNHWRKVDSVRLKSLQQFGIRYIISDFNPNLIRVRQQPVIEKLSPAVISGEEIMLPFQAKITSLRQIRFLPANFNRLNTCKLSISVIDNQSRKEAAKIPLSCQDVRDKMFMTVSLSAKLSLGRTYILKIASQQTDRQNAIALWTNGEGLPYIELFYANTKPALFKRMWEGRSIDLWEVPESWEVLLDGTYSQILQSPEKTVLLIHANRRGVAEIKKTFYPGWQASVDNNETPIIRLGPFMGVLLPKGDHKLILEYRPQSFFMGIMISLITFFGVATLLAYNFWSRQRKNKFPLKTLFSQFRH